MDTGKKKTVVGLGLQDIKHDVTPSYYQSKRIEVIDFIEAFLKAHPYAFHLGCVIKYICRAGKKNSELEDLHKAKWYLERVIKNLEKE